MNSKWIKDQMVKDKRNGRNMGDLKIKFFLAKINISKVKRQDKWRKLFVPHIKEPIF